MRNRIKHSGKVEKMGDGCIKVRIVQMAACSSCNAAHICQASEKKEKIVDVYDFDPDAGYKEGDDVTVTASLRVGMNAVLIAFGLPFVILVGVVFVVSLFTDDEPTMALSGICALIPYYILMYISRHRFREKFSFRIEGNS
ncbi:MAG: SoxR reducing system RseC family protein [Prevotella sp.]|uniref:SoxR reducing system RseC family protein n=1 Tax=Prevotella sp. TaxID=59823 RepID=UPI002A29D1EE|nr:SoxR reducing system RseC family protein [Prevotella sp.]MDD7318851.1 SoxR reducing system RseC family protein [Prevotellaceae bacterium]MDY4019228.1 SoxR reducing system RseC family protein [Prevotella sp.]